MMSLTSDDRRGSLPPWLDSGRECFRSNSQNSTTESGVLTNYGKKGSNQCDSNGRNTALKKLSMCALFLSVILFFVVTFSFYRLTRGNS